MPADEIARRRNMRDFADQLRARRVEVSLVSVPGGHGTALGSVDARAALGRFVAARSGTLTPIRTRWRGGRAE